MSESEDIDRLLAKWKPVLSNPLWGHGESRIAWKVLYKVSKGLDGPHDTQVWADAIKWSYAILDGLNDGKSVSHAGKLGKKGKRDKSSKERTRYLGDDDSAANAESGAERAPVGLFD